MRPLAAVFVEILIVDRAVQTPTENGLGGDFQ